MNFVKGLAKFACSALLAVAGMANADTYPSKTITLVNPFAAGGSLDILARLLAEQVSKSLGQSVIVENKPGAGAVIGTAHVARARPDGYTLLITAGNIVSAPALGMPVQYDWKNSFVPITMLGSIGQAIAVSSDLPVKSLQELTSLAKSREAPLAMGSLGPGSGGYINGKLLQQATGITFTDISYKGMSETMSALAGGHIQVALGNLPEVLTYQKSGKMRPIAVVLPNRSRLAPDVPTLEESGLQDVLIPVWYGLLAPAGTPPEIVSKLNSVFSKAMHSAELQKRLDDMSITPVAGPPEDFRRQLQVDFNKFAKFKQAQR